MKKQTVIALGIVALAITAVLGIKAVNNGLNPHKTIITGAYKVGDEAADFSFVNIDDKRVSLADFKDAKGFIVVFTTNHCPFAVAYEDRVEALNKKYAVLGYPVVALNSNDPKTHETDDLAHMKTRAKEKGFTFPYLVDETSIGQTYGATKTPHTFVIQKENGKNIVKYIGAIDDNSQDASSVTKRYVEDAVNSLLAGKPIAVSSTKAVGCGIKYRTAE